MQTSSVLRTMSRAQLIKKKNSMALLFRHHSFAGRRHLERGNSVIKPAADNIFWTGVLSVLMQCQLIQYPNLSSKPEDRKNPFEDLNGMTIYFRLHGNKTLRKIVNVHGCYVFSLPVDASEIPKRYAVLRECSPGMLSPYVWEDEDDLCEFACVKHEWFLRKPIDYYGIPLGKVWAQTSFGSEKLSRNTRKKVQIACFADGEMLDSATYLNLKNGILRELLLEEDEELTVDMNKLRSTLATLQDASTPQAQDIKQKISHVNRWWWILPTMREKLSSQWLWILPTMREKLSSKEGDPSVSAAKDSSSDSGSSDEQFQPSTRRSISDERMKDRRKRYIDHTYKYVGRPYRVRA